MKNKYIIYTNLPVLVSKKKKKEEKKMGRFSHLFIQSINSLVCV